jgi:hypothetical protein
MIQPPGAELMAAVEALPVPPQIADDSGGGVAVEGRGGQPHVRLWDAVIGNNTLGQNRAAERATFSGNSILTTTVQFVVEDLRPRL